MPIIYNRLTGLRHDIDEADARELANTGHLTWSGQTTYVFREPRIPAPEPVANTAEEGTTTVETDANGIRWVNMGSNLHRTITNISRLNNPLSNEEPDIERVTPDRSWMPRSLEMAEEHFTNEMLTYPSFAFKKTKHVEEDTTKYGEYLNSVLKKIGDFKKNLNPLLRLYIGKVDTSIHIISSAKKTRVLYKKDNNYVVENTDNCFHIPRSLTRLDEIKELCFVKIKSYEESGKIFGYSNVKRKMMNEGLNYTIFNILPDFVCKKDEVKRDIVEVTVNDKNIKFLIDDLEFIFPDTELLTKGYTAPKDRTIKTGTKIQVTNNKGNRGLVIGSRGTVVNVTKLKSKRNQMYLEVNINNNVQQLIKKNIKIIE